MKMARKTIKRAVAGAAFMSTVLVLAACGTDDNGNGNGAGGGADSATCDTIGDTIKLVVVKDLSGTGAVAGGDAWQGIQVGETMLNESNFIEGTTFEVELKDSASDTQTGANHVSAAVADPDVKAVLGPVLSEMALAAGPVAERGGLPIVFTQAGGEGVLSGDYTFRATPPFSTYYAPAVDHLADNGVETISVIHTSDNATLIELANDIVPPLAEERGMNVAIQVPVSVSTQDLATPVQRALEVDPDGLVMLPMGVQLANAVSQVRQAGFEGPIISYAQAGAAMESIGERGKDVAWMTNYHYSQTNAEAVEFREAFKAEFGDEPSNYAAEGYDSLMWVAHAIKEQNCDSREGVHAGLKKVAEQGFDGAQGHITFEGNDARLEGILVQWNGSDIEVMN